MTNFKIPENFKYLISNIGFLNNGILDITFSDNYNNKKISLHFNLKDVSNSLDKLEKKLEKTIPGITIEELYEIKNIICSNVVEFDNNKKAIKSFEQSKDNSNDTCEGLSYNKNYQSYENAPNKKKNKKKSSNSNDQRSEIDDEIYKMSVEDGYPMGGVQMKCATNCIMCPGEYIFGHFKIVCKCDCHEIEKHFEVKTFKSYLTNNSEFNKYLHILSKHKHLELRIEDILLTKYKADHHQNNNNLPKIGTQNISVSTVVSIDKAFFENDKLLYYELKEIGKEELSILFKFAFNNVCNNVTIDTVILK